MSACLYGENVRYDGKNSSIQDNPIFQQIQQIAQIHSFCPEVEGGLDTPRIPSEIIQSNPLQLKNQNGEDTTRFFIAGAQKTLEYCIQNDIQIALMKSKSPSCSNEFIYDGTFTKKMLNGSGVTVSILKKNNFIIFDENQLEQLLDFLKSSPKVRSN